jgi:rubrerythrin
MSSVWETAKSMEKQGMEFYRAQAAAAPNAELKGVFNLLADEEKTHYEFFERIKKKMPAGGVGPSDTIGKVKEAFAAMTAGFATPDVLKTAATVYHKALGMEQGAVEFYSAALSTAKGPAEKKALEAVIEEEKRHVRIFESLLDFVARPDLWVENAEFSKIEEY